MGKCGKGRTAKPTKTYNLLVLYPEIAKLFHSTKNGDTKTTDLTPGMEKPLRWWQDTNPECGHEWEKSVMDMVANYKSRKKKKQKGNGCPYCHGKKVDINNCAATLKPELLRFFDSENNTKTLYEVTVHCGETFSWKCPECDHKWKATVNTLSKGSGCKPCSDKRSGEARTNSNATAEYNLEIICPKIAILLHPNKNGDVTARDIMPGTSQEFWWFNKTCGHEWFKSVCEMVQSYNNRKTKKHICPICNRRPREVNDKNCAATTHPELLELFDQKLNTKTLFEVKAFARDIFLWRCKRDHSWPARIAMVSKGSRCPKCSANISNPQRLLYSELLYMFSSTKLGIKINKTEFDVFVEELNLAIEYDGYPWHKDTSIRDLRKNKIAENLNIKLLRVRDSRLGKLSHEDVLIDGSKETMLLEDFMLPVIFALKKYVTDEFLLNRVNDYIFINEFRNYKFYETIRDQARNQIVQNHINITHPKKAKQWGENGILKPEMFTAGSHQIINWVCEINPSHKWSNSIKRECRKKSDCTKCNHQQASDSYN